MTRAPWAGAAITVALLGSHEVLSRSGMEVPAPASLALVAVVVSALYGGMRAGFVSAGLVLVYAVARLSASGLPLVYGGAEGSQLLLLVVMAPALAYGVGRLRSRGALAKRRLDAANIELGRQRAELEAQRAELAAERRSRLTAFQRLGLAAGTRSDRRALLSLVAETAQDLASARGAAVLLPGAGGELEVAAAHGIGAEDRWRWAVAEAAAFTSGSGGGGVRLVDGGAAPPALRGLVEAHAVATVMVAPVPGPEAAFAGALVVLDPRAERAAAVEAIEAAAAQAGAVLARLRLERQSARRARRARLLSTAIEQLQLGVTIAGPDGRIRYANAVAARLHGTERCALRGMRLDRLYPSASFSVLLDEGEESGSGEVLHQRADGSAIPVQLTVASLRTRAGGRFATVLIARDVSDEKRQQAQLMESDRLALVGGLVSAVAHELNNPLAAIGNFAELLRADEEDRERVEMLDTIAREVARAGRIVRNLLSFSRPSSAVRGWARLSEVVERTVALRIYDQRRRRIEVGIEIQPDLPAVWCDANQLQQVLLNLIVNAEQAIGSDGRITIRGRAEDDAVELIVEDTGPGIAPEVLPRIFAPFVTTKDQQAGTGLGLSISRDIVEAHGGKIAAENRKEGGARFVVRLPTAPNGHQPAVPPAT